MKPAAPEKKTKKMVVINGSPQDVCARNLAQLLIELDYGSAIVATARNREFVRTTQRITTEIVEGDEIEILTPMQGG